MPRREMEDSGEGRPAGSPPEDAPAEPFSLVPEPEQPGPDSADQAPVEAGVSTPAAGVSTTREETLSPGGMDQGAAEDQPVFGLEPEYEAPASGEEILSEIGISLTGDGEGARALEDMAAQLHGLSEQLDGLRSEFQEKIKENRFREETIERLHKELQVHREGIVKKHLHSVVVDVIKLIDDLRRLVGHYRSKELTADDLPKLLDILSDIPRDLEDLFLWQGVSSFVEEGNRFDPSRQRITRKIVTDDPSLDKTIAERVLPGYEWDGKVIRPELVAVYVCDRADAKSL